MENITAKKQKKILFLCMDPFFPDSSGGAELSSLTLFKKLKKDGWEILILCRNSKKIKIEGSDENLRVSDFIYSMDIISGFLCLRYPENVKFSELEKLFMTQLKEFKPTHIIGELLNSRIEECFNLLEKASQLDTKTFCFVRLIEGIKALKKSNIRPPKRTKLLANSQFTAKEIYSTFQMEAEIVNPFIDIEKIKAPIKTPKYITFINPIEVKGVVTAIEIAEKMHEQDFLFVTGGWDKNNYDKSNHLITKIKSIKNIKFIEYQKNMSTVYGETKILLVPSNFEETFGRVILEAQSNGIPVIGSNRGNIAYTVGNGGIVIDDYKNADIYVEKIKLLLDDQDLYEKYSSHAYAQSSKKEFSLNHQLEKIISILEK